MKTIGWIRQFDKAACGGVVAEASIAEKSYGKGYTFQGAAMSCKKNCTIVDGHPHTTLRNGRQRVVHGQHTSGGCALTSTLNDIDGIANSSGKNMADKFMQDSEGNMLEVFLPRVLSSCDFDQHVILTDEEGGPLDAIFYRLLDSRGAVIAGVTGADGRTEIMGGNEGELLSLFLGTGERA